jgi:uncharacterized protein
VHLSGIFIYPVKSLRGFAVSSANVDALGLIGDRRFLVVDQQGRFLTQRVLPQMALIETELTPNNLILRAVGTTECMVAIRSSPAPVTTSVSIWKSEGLIAEDCGDQAADWLSSFLRVNCRLVRIGRHFRRPVLNRHANEGDVLAFADGCPFLVISESSLADLNDRIAERGEEPVPMNRFRPNLVITDSAAFAEDEWDRIKIGSVVFRKGGACERCIITTTDQLTGERRKEPLRTLASYRRSTLDQTAINFGQNFIHEMKTGSVRLEDSVEIL